MREQLTEKMTEILDNFRLDLSPGALLSLADALSEMIDTAEAYQQPASILQVVQVADIAQIMAPFLNCINVASVPVSVGTGRTKAAKKASSKKVVRKPARKIAKKKR